MAMSTISSLAVYEMFAAMYGFDGVYITKPLSDTNTKEIVKNSKLIDAIIVVPIKPKANEKWTYKVYFGYDSKDTSINPTEDTTLDLMNMTKGKYFNEIDFLKYLPTKKGIPTVISLLNKPSTVDPNTTEDTSGGTISPKPNKPKKPKPQEKPKPKIYTVIIDESSNDPSAVEYADDAVGMEAGWDNWKGHPLFKDIRPCILDTISGSVIWYLHRDNRTLAHKSYITSADIENGNDVYEVLLTLYPYDMNNDTTEFFIEFPHRLGFKFERIDNKLHVSITDSINVEGFDYSAFWNYRFNDFGNKLYISSYHLETNKFKSLPTNILTHWDIENPYNTKSNTYQAYIDHLNEEGVTNNKIGYNWKTHTLLQCLYLLIFKNLDSQAVLGKGSNNKNRGKYNTSTDDWGHTPFVYGNTEEIGHPVTFLGLEDWYNFKNTWIYGDTISPSNITDNNTGYIDKVYGTNELGFLPKFIKGTSTTKYRDYSWVNPTDAKLVTGGISNITNGDGVFYVASRNEQITEDESNELGYRSVFIY